MVSQPRRDTVPELALRRALHRAGLRFRVQFQVPGKSRRTIDIAFTRVKVAVFVDGCFWHGCPVHGVSPKNNADWWQRKIDANRVRDEDTASHLEGLGWAVLRFWEHDDALVAVRAVQEAVVARKGGRRGSASLG